jgi:hypothetical protein
MEKEIQKSILLFNKESYELEKELEEPVELGLEEYIEFVVREVRKANKH